MIICDKDKLCSGCCACLNICPKDAISMKEDKFGFIFPEINKERCIDCGLCKKVCNTIVNKNKPIKTLIAQTKEYKLSQHSSSGGLFAAAAEYVLSQGGIVVGAAMEKINDKFLVKHICIENKKDLYKLQGSKYVQSIIGKTYKETKKFLEKGKTVLFSGTPCQISALKAYLDKYYQNLITIDLSCEGVPSQKMFNDYVKFLEKNQTKNPIVDFKFRNKEFCGWNCSKYAISYSKKNRIYTITTAASDTYHNLFAQCNILRENCYKCNFAAIERISDITIGDAWGIEFEYPELLIEKFKKDKGISVVLVNTDKGIDILNKIKEKLIINNINIDKLKKYNHPLSHTSLLTDDRKDYLNAYDKSGWEAVHKLFRKKTGFIKLLYLNIKSNMPDYIKNFIKICLNKPTPKTDALLLTLYCLPNYGSLLTAYALSKAVSDIGFSNQIIHYGNLYGYGKSFVKRYLKLTKRCVNNKDFKSLNKLTDTFILGSDNLLDFSSATLGFTSRSLLNFADEDKKKIMISGSLGNWDGTTKQKEEKDYIKSLLSRFDYLSTREEKGKNIFQTEYGINADWINDPVFYIGKCYYDRLIENADINIPENTIMNYILYPNNETEKIVKSLKEKYRAEEVKFAGNENVSSDNKNDSVENWLSAIKNSKIIITDSFHCICFALIFNKPFICIKNTHATVRFTSLFNKLGINVKLVEKVEDIEENMQTSDFQIVNENIDKIRNFAQTKLKEIFALENKKNKDTDSFIQMNREYFALSDLWYKKSKVFYFTVIVPIVLPIKRYLHDKKQKR